MLMHHHWSPEMWVWALSTKFGIIVFSMTFIIATLVIVNLGFLTLFWTHYFFGKKGIYTKGK